MQYFNGTDYDTLYPQTTMAQVSSLNSIINSLNSKIENKFVKIKEFVFNFDTKYVGNYGSSIMIEIDVSSYSIIKLLFNFTKDEMSAPIYNPQFSLGGAQLFSNSITLNKGLSIIALNSFAYGTGQKLYFITDINPNIRINNSYSLGISHTNGGPWAVNGTVVFYGLK